MSKNVIDKKSITVKDQLFEEILNGFTDINAQQDEKVTYLGQVQKARLPLVAEQFLRDKRTNTFTKEWISNLTGLNVFEQLMASLRKKPLDDDEEEQDDEEIEEPDEKSFLLFSLWRMHKLLTTMRLLYNAYTLYNASKDKIKVSFEEIDIILKNRNINEDIKGALVIDSIKNMNSHLFITAALNGGRVLFKYIDENKQINALFDKLDQYIEDKKTEIAIKAGINLAINTALLLMPEPSGVSKVVSLARWGTLLYSYGSLAWEGGKFLYYYNTVFRDFDNEDAEDLRQWVEKNVANQLHPVAKQVDDKMFELQSEFKDKLDVAQYVENKIKGIQDDIRGDAFTIKRVGEFVGATKLQDFNNVGGRRLIEVDQSYNQSTGSYKIKFDNFDVSNTIISDLENAHNFRYDIQVDVESKVQLKDRQTGLFVMRYIDFLDDKLISWGSKVYSHVLQFNDIVNEKIQLKVDEINTQLQLSKDKQEPQPAHKPLQKKASNPSIPQTSKIKRLRFSERTLQPIHPIFHSGALIGMELYLMDKDDKEIDIKIPSFKNYNAINNPSLDVYTQMMNTLDIIRDHEIDIIDVEKTINQTVEEIIENILTL